MTTEPEQVTQLLMEWRNGDAAALDRLIPLVYRELRKMAKRYMVHQNPGHTLQTTAVIHEAYLKLAGDSEKHWENRAHFFAVAATAMRHILVDRARAKHSAKRGGDVRVVPLEEGIAVVAGKERELIALDDALTALAKLHPRQGQVVELRYFGGLSVAETSKVIKVSPETVGRDWQFASAFLRREISHATRE